MKNNLLLISQIRKSRTVKWVSIKLCLIMLLELGFYQTDFAVTSGPGQPEFSGFQQFDNSEMVDLYSGNFKYNIPLLTVPGPNGGYPINLSYSSGVGMEEEASWVGLGWSLNVGAITRNLRGMPDDFKGEVVKQEMNLKKNSTYSLNIPLNSNGLSKEELFGVAPKGPDKPSTGYIGQIYFNTYKGVGFRATMNMPISKNNYSKTGLGLSFDSQNGIGIEPDFTIAQKYGDITNEANISTSYNTRSGLQGFSFSNKITFSRDNSSENSTDGYGAMLSSNLSFSVNQDFPTVSIPMKTNITSFDVSVGQAPGFGSYKTKFPKYWSGNVVNSTVANGGKANTKAYGYLYNNSASDRDLKDVNKKNTNYSKKIPFLPSGSFTYDIYTISGQGTSGMFRPYRSEATILNSAAVESESITRRTNAEAGAQTSNVHIGLGYTNSTTTQYSGKWQSGTSDLESALNNYNTASDDFEQFYFQEYGEKVAEKASDNQLNNWMGDDAVRVNLSKSGSWNDREFIASSEITKSAFGSKQSITSPAKDSRQKKGKVIQSFTFDQVKKFGYSKDVKYCDVSSGEASCKSKSNDDHSIHHVNEINVIETDGVRYTYGLPVYNIEHTDVNMSVNSSGKSGDIVSVHSASHLGTNNEYLSKTDIPEYVHSWLLTSLVSSDYVDVRNDGITDDDLGYWVKFHYTKIHSNYTWRTPYEGALFQEGTSSSGDNSASFSRGKKEIYVLKAIETKTHVAVFSTSNREDAIEANSSNLYATSPTPSGGKKLKKLDKISLYAKHNFSNSWCDYCTYNISKDPIQEVHFKYNYELCGNVINNSGSAVIVDGQNINVKKGKLTLKGLYNTYLNSNKGEWGQYEFNYGSNPIDNPDYERKNMERWGNYVDNSIYSNYNSLEFPYTQQDNNNLSVNYGGSAPSNIHASPWTLKNIKMPGGGEINIYYESDDYAYVENRKAMRMFDIVNIGKGINTSTYDLNILQSSYPYRDNQTNIFSSTKDKSENLYYRIYFELEESISSQTLNYQDACNDFVKKYVGDIKHIWYKTKMDLMVLGFPENIDYLSGYCELEEDKNNINKFGVARHPGVTTGNYTLGFVTVKPVDISEVNLTGQQIHPFRKAAFQHLIVNRPELVWGINNINGNGLTALKNLVTGTASIITDLLKTITGFNLFAVGQGWATDVYLNGNSIIRLQDPNGKKYGGGTRVKKIEIKDNWNKDNYSDAVYGYEYSYLINENGNEISSGVAYEPQIGNEESALRNFIPYTNSTPLSTTENLFLETPLFEEYYPGASVGYRKVTVKSIGKKVADSDGNDITTSAAPVSVNEFYSPKDFPVLFDFTDMSADPAIVRPTIVPGFYTSYKKKLARSQGYSVVLNDMAGKPKAVTRYTYPNDVNAPLGNVISKDEYTYYTASDYKENSVNRLVSTVPVITSEGNYEKGIVGQSHDIFILAHENAIESNSQGFDGNLDFKIIASPPFVLPIIPTAFPHEDESETSLRTIVTNKIIYRTGILKEVTSTKNESLIKQQYLAFDKTTGNPLLVKTFNEFRDPVYTYTIPAYGQYEGMAEAYKRINIEKTVANMNGSNIVLNSSSFVSVGDFVAVINNGIATLGYVVSKSGNDINVKDFKSANISATSGGVVKIIRPANHNKLTTDAGKIIFKTLTNFDPVNYSTANFSTNDIIDASATEFDDTWQGPCNACYSLCNYEQPPCASLSFNLGKKGIWRPKREHVYETERNYTANTIKNDGTYTDFSMFNWVSPHLNSSKWIPTGVVTEYSPLGVPIESIDAIGNFSAAQYGYNVFYFNTPTQILFPDALIKAVGVNTRYNEMFYEGFETFDNMCYLGNCIYNYSSSFAHTGKKSIKINAASTCEIEANIYEPCDKDMTPFYPRVGDPCECIPKFSPFADKKYVLSAWAKQIQTGVPYNYPDAKITVEYHDGNGLIGSTSLNTSGFIIEGWQKIEGSFYIPNNATFIKVIFGNTSTSNQVYFDDLRIHPFDANMKSYVYNLDTYKISAELDNNNYATFYIYDEEGKLTKMKKETIEGIKTFMESRMALEITNP